MAALFAVTLNFLQPLAHAASMRDGNPSALWSMFCNSAVADPDNKADATPPKSANTHECCLGLAHAPSLIQILIQAMEFEITVPDLARRQYWIHPAMAEVVADQAVFAKAALANVDLTGANLVRFDPAQPGPPTPVPGTIGLRAASDETPQGIVALFATVFFVLIGTGIGVTPQVSVLRSLAHCLYDARCPKCFTVNPAMAGAHGDGGAAPVPGRRGAHRGGPRGARRVGPDAAGDAALQGRGVVRLRA